MSFISEQEKHFLNVKVDLRNEGLRLHSASSAVGAFFREKLDWYQSAVTPPARLHRLICYHLPTNQTRLITPNVVVVLTQMLCCSLIAANYFPASQAFRCKRDKPPLTVWEEVICFGGGRIYERN